MSNHQQPFIWFHLVNRDANGFRQAVIDAKPDWLSSLDASQLKIYKNKTAFDGKQEALEDNCLVSDFGFSDHDARVVLLPTPTVSNYTTQQPQSNRNWRFIMSVCFTNDYAIFESNSMEYIAAQTAAVPAIADVFQELGSLFTSKLWHQLGCKLTEVISMDYFKINQNIVQLYPEFVAKCARDIDPLILVQIILQTSQQIKDTQEKFDFVNSQTDLVKKEFGPLLLLKLELASLLLLQGDHPGCQAALDEAQTEFHSRQAELPVSVPSRFYQVKMEYHKVVGTAAEFFQNAILYLSYTPLEISLPQQVELSSNLGLSALASESQYNFGELLQHPILNSLNGTSNQWINDLLQAFDQGSIEKFEALYKQYSSFQPILCNNAAFLRQKIRIMNLMEMVFKRPSNDRSITFGEISQICQITIDEVELLLMKAMSLGVIQGVIDQVEQIVRIKRVQPRVLNLAQVESLRTQLISWTDKVHNAVSYLENTGPELMTA